MPLKWRLSDISSVLTSLDVGQNDLDEQATLNIVRAARQQDKMMASLGLQRCGVGASGAQGIAEYVRFSGVLTSLNLKYNNMVDGEAALREIAKDRPSLILEL